MRQDDENEADLEPERGPTELRPEGGPDHRGGRPPPEPVRAITAEDADKTWPMAGSLGHILEHLQIAAEAAAEIADQMATRNSVPARGPFGPELATWNRDGRKVKVTLHWVAAARAREVEVRLYDRLFGLFPLGQLYRYRVYPTLLAIDPPAHYLRMVTSVPFFL